MPTLGRNCSPLLAPNFLFIFPPMSARGVKYHTQLIPNDRRVVDSGVT